MEDMKWKYYKKSLVLDEEIHFEPVVNKKQAKLILKKYKAFFLRYTTAFDKEKTSVAYYIIKSDWGGIEELSSNTRNQVRKALKMCNVRVISQEELSEKGVTSFNKSMTKYNSNFIPLKKEEYKREILTQQDREYFGCFDLLTSELIAYSQNIVGKGVSYSLVKANPDYYKSNYPQYALFFKMNEYYLFEQNKKYVSDGFRTLDSHSNIQDFLIKKFKFRKAYCDLHIVYNFWFGNIVKALYPIRKIILNRKIQAILFQHNIFIKNRY
jgi:hypothetical protein